MLLTQPRPSPRFEKEKKDQAVKVIKPSKYFENLEYVSREESDHGNDPLFDKELVPDENIQYHNFTNSTQKIKSIN